jgi:uncharacterized protein (DUF2141 family)
MKSLMLAAVLTTAAFPLSRASASECTGTIRAVLDGIRGNSGNLCYQLFAGEEGFPTDPAHAVRGGCMAVSGRNEIVIEGLCDGSYALSFLHDVNGNGQLDTGAFGIPTEPFGFSNNPQIRMGPPSYAECAFELRSEAAMTIQMRSF